MNLQLQIFRLKNIFVLGFVIHVNNAFCVLQKQIK